MRTLFTGILLLLFSCSFAQSLYFDSAEVKNTSIEFNGGKYEGYSVDLAADPEIVEDAIKEQFKLQGVKPKEIKGFMVYRNVRMPILDPERPMDAFVKVERKSKKEKEQSIVYFIGSTPGDIPEEKVKSGNAARNVSASGVAAGGAFLSGMIPHIRKGVYDKDIASRQSALKKEEKKMADLVEDLEEMEKKLVKLQSDIEYNKKAQERQVAEVEKLKSSLSELVSKNQKAAQ